MRIFFTLLLLVCINFTLIAQQFRAIMIDPPGTDDPLEYFEITGTSGQSLTGKCFVVIDGDGINNPGTIDQKIDLSAYTIGSNGILLYRSSAQLGVSSATTTVTQDFSPDLENGTTTFVLMDCPTQNVGDDLDTDNDGVIDAGLFSGKTVYDAISKTDGDATNKMYAAGLGGVNIPVKPTTTGVTADYIFRDVGTVFGAQLKDPQVSPPLIAIQAAWLSSGTSTTTYNGSNTSNGNTPGPFPVTLISFKGFTLGRQVVLDWKTTDALNFSHFSVERSRDAQSFEAIAQINAIAASSNLEVSYQYVDEQPNFGINYYRLRQVDIDNGFEYSKIIAVSMTEASPIIIYPNPATESLKINYGEDEKIKSYGIYNSTGKLIRESNALPEAINIQDLPTGLYTLQFLNQDNVHINRKFIKK